MRTVSKAMKRAFQIDDGYARKAKFGNDSAQSGQVKDKRRVESKGYRKKGLKDAC